MVLRNRVGDQLTLAYQTQTEGLIAPFEISSGIIVPIGEYDNGNIGIQLNTASHRKLAASARIVNYQYGDFFGGSRHDEFAQLSWRPSARVSSSVSYSYSEIDLPAGNFETRLLSMGLDFAFSSTLSLVNLLQYDNVSEIAGINMRLHWIPQAGKELYFVINHNLEDFDRDNEFRSLFSDMTAKVNYTFRF